MPYTLSKKETIELSKYIEKIRHSITKPLNELSAKEKNNLISSLGGIGKKWNVTGPELFNLINMT